MIAEREPIVQAESATRAAVQVEAARPIILTKKMKEIEIRFGQPIEAVINNYYWVQKVSLRQIGEEIGVGYPTLHKWTKRLQIKVRSYSEAQILLGSNTAEVNAARAESLRRYHKNHPEIAKNVRNQQKKAMEARIRQAFGDKPAGTLQAWHWEEGLTIAAIARKVGRSWGFVSRAMVNLGVERKDVLLKYLQDLAIGMRANLPETDWLDIFSFQRLRDKGIINGDHQQRTIDNCQEIINRGRRLKGATDQDGIGDVSFGQFYDYLMLCLRFIKANPGKRRKLQAVAKS